jgi:hypothetical protein
MVYYYLVTITSCISSKNTCPDYQNYLYSYLQEEFSRSIEEKKIIYVVLLKEKKSISNFLIYEDMNYPSEKRLPMEFAKISDSYIFLYDYRVKPIKPSEVTFPLLKNTAIFDNGLKKQYIILTCFAGKLSHTIGSKSDGIKLFLSEEYFQKYKDKY